MERFDIIAQIKNKLSEIEFTENVSVIVEDLLRVKKETSELGTGPKIPELDEYIREQMELMQNVADRAENRKNDWDKLEEFFKSAVL